MDNRFSQNNRGKSRQSYVNEAIKAFKIIVIDVDGENLGTMSRSNALQLAKDQWLDLVQMSYNPVDKVSTAKLIDYGKYLYEQKKIQREKRKNQKKTWLKQVKVAYAIAENDLLFKIKQMRWFLEEGYMVRLSVRLKWRENIYKDRAIEKLEFVKEELQDVAKTQSSYPKQEKTTYSYIFVRA